MITELRALQKLPQIVPILIRHLDAYVELIEQDLAEAAKALITKARALALLAISAVFALSMLCLLVIAATWDGEYRLLAIGGLAALFVTVCAVMAAKLLRRPTDGAFATLRREWRQDRALFEAWLARLKDDSADPASPTQPQDSQHGVYSEPAYRSRAPSAARSGPLLHTLKTHS